MKTTDALMILLDVSKILGLGDEDLKNAKDFLDHGEPGLCLDTIITQIYEYDIEINNEFYEAISKIASKMNLTVETYSFMRDLITGGENIPESVKNELLRIR